ncbi:hypothetical protein Peur_033098 [Populus x canadensis]
MFAPNGDMVFETRYGFGYDASNHAAGVYAGGELHWIANMGFAIPSKIGSGSWDCLPESFAVIPCAVYCDDFLSKGFKLKL